MTTTNAELTLAVALVRTAHLVDAVFGDVSREHGLTPQHTQLLCMLVGGPVGMTELGRLLHLERSGLSGLVDRVERRGLVTRVRDERDRRAYSVALTAKGSRIADHAHEDVVSRLDARTATLSRADRDRLAAVLNAFLATRAG